MADAYAGTVYKDLWMLYHDGLTAWWTPSSQKYIEERGWKYRQICSRDPTKVLNPAKPGTANRYRNKVTGDSPETAVATDNQGKSSILQKLTSIVSWLTIVMCFIRVRLFQAIDKFSPNVDPIAAH